MPWVREGECKQCGRCCVELMGYRPMLNEKGICMYLVGSDCKIRNAVIAKDTSSIPQEHLEYWKIECEPYPDPNEEAHTPPIHRLVEGCGFKMVWRDE